MISFTCKQCQKQFTVPDTYAGRRARCKGCRNEVVVPPAPKPTGAGKSSAAPAVPKPPMRVRRLTADATAMRTAFASCPHIKIQKTIGDPPEIYQIQFNVAGLERGKNNQPIARQQHVAEIQLTADYPRLPPKCKMLTPIFHPNIDTSTICIGDHWTAGERLVDLVIRIAELIGYQAYNIRSPLDGEAAMWADLNPQRLPTDGRDLSALGT